MVPMRHSSIFKSRWFALLWAAGILWFAHDVAGSAPNADTNADTAQLTDATGAEINAEQVEELARALNAM